MAGATGYNSKLNQEEVAEKSRVRIFFNAVWTIYSKDIRTELRTKEIFSAMAIFSLLVVMIFAFALPGKLKQAGDVAPGLLWAAFTFAGVLGLNRSFINEKDRGSLEGLLLAPNDRSAIFLGKALGNFTFIIVVELLIAPIFSILFNFSVLNPGLLPVLLLGTIGFAEIGTLFAAMAVNTRAREVLLPVLFFPIMLPVIIAAAQSTAAIIANRPFEEVSGAFGLMLFFDCIFLVVPLLLFELVLEE
ncbi:MAG TPA: heme exporter protein CcmB [Chloroflexia bacterium]|nr:heme exporter protein CcmB [Chloroflexia bacterium]